MASDSDPGNVPKRVSFNFGCFGAVFLLAPSYFFKKYFKGFSIPSKAYLVLVTFCIAIECLIIPHLCFST